MMNTKTCIQDIIIISMFLCSAGNKFYKFTRLIKVVQFSKANCHSLTVDGKVREIDGAWIIITTITI